jgi:hypothetical protein
MKQSISYNLTDKESTLLKVSAKKFAKPSFFESLNIRSLIDPGSHEYKLDLKSFPETEEGEIQKIWYKLLHIVSAFCNHIDFKASIHENVKRMTRVYNDYDRDVKSALAEYILFLRTGSSNYELECELVENMTIDSMVDLLSAELCYRTSFYNNKDEMIVEIATIHYDYDEIKEKFKEKYIEYITTTEHTKYLIRHRQMIASMWAE